MILDPLVCGMLGITVHRELDATSCPGCGAVRARAIVSGSMEPALVVLSDECGVLAECRACDWSVTIDRPSRDNEESA